MVVPFFACRAHTFDAQSANFVRLLRQEPHRRPLDQVELDLEVELGMARVGVLEQVKETW